MKAALRKFVEMLWLLDNHQISGTARLHVTTPAPNIEKASAL